MDNNDFTAGEILSLALEDNCFLEETSRLSKRFVDGEPVNRNPLTELPEVKMRLYGVDDFLQSTFFDTEEELKSYLKENISLLGEPCIIEYLGSVAGQSDVIRKIDTKGNALLYTAIDEDGYATYNPERSFYRGQFTWEYNYGNLRDWYQSFRSRGIVLEEDIYHKIDIQQKKFFKCLEDHLRDKK